MPIQQDVINTGFLADWNNCLNEAMITVPRAGNSSPRRLKKPRKNPPHVDPCFQSFKILILEQLRRWCSETAFFGQHSGQHCGGSLGVTYSHRTQLPGTVPWNKWALSERFECSRFPSKMGRVFPTE